MGHWLIGLFYHRMGRKGRRKVGEDANIGSVMLKCKKIFYNPLINPPFLHIIRVK